MKPVSRILICAAQLLFAAVSLLAPCQLFARGAYTISVDTGGGMANSGPARSVRLEYAQRVALEPDGNLLIIDTNRTLRRDVASGLVTVIAGTPDPLAAGGFGGDGGPATSALLRVPRGIVVDASGNIFLADTGNNRIRRIDKATGNISTIAGNGTPAFSGDGGLATEASITGVFGLGLDLAGGLLIPDQSNLRIRRVDLATGIISTFAGGGVSTSENILATDAALCYPSAVLAAPDGYVYLTSCTQVKRINVATGRISTYVNSPTGQGFTAPGFLASDTRLIGPESLQMDPDGNLLICESSNGRVLRGCWRGYRYLRRARWNSGVGCTSEPV